MSPAAAHKKTTKHTESKDDSAAAPQPQLAEKGKLTEKTESNPEKPNWLTDPRFAKKDKEGNPPLPPDNENSIPGKPGWGLRPPEGGWTPPNVVPPQKANPMPPMGQPQPPVGGLPPMKPNVGAGQQQPPAAGGVPQPGPPPGNNPGAAAPRSVAKDDMREVWVLIDTASGASGTMPGPDVIYRALIQAKSPAAELIKDGLISLTGTRTRQSVWAYETAALKQGGLVVSQNGVERVTAAQLVQRLMGK